MFTIHSDSGSCFASNSIGSFLNRRSSLFSLSFFSFFVCCFPYFSLLLFHLFLFLFLSLSLSMLPVNFCRYFREACTRGPRMRIHDRNNASISIVFLAQPAFRAIKYGRTRLRLWGYAVWIDCTIEDRIYSRRPVCQSELSSRVSLRIRSMTSKFMRASVCIKWNTVYSIFRITYSIPIWNIYILEIYK